MYNPPAFSEEDLSRRHTFIRDYPLGLLISATVTGLRASPLPFVLETTGAPFGVLRGHLARANDHWQALEGADVLVVFQGLHAYVSPSWYASKTEHGKVVPTWNYVMVQARGVARVRDDEHWLRQQITRLTETHESSREMPWHVADAPPAFIEAQLRGIVGVETQQGQGLAELLGYRLERGLHDNNDLEMDIFIYELRKVFPLASNRLKRTAIKPGRIASTALEATRFTEEESELQGDKTVTKIEARNVVDGLALLEHIKESGQASYPFGFPIGTGPGKLRQATGTQRDAIDAEVRRITNIGDAIADLALSESVHQVVQGNYDRTAGALDAHSKGAFPQIPDVIQSPASGKTLTHRFGHLPPGVSPAAGSTPRAKAEPAPLI